MSEILEFIKIAAPWIAVGLCVTILVVRGLIKREKSEKRNGNYGAEGMCLGMCFGLLVGTAFDGYVGVGISVGMIVGLIIGSCVPKRQKNKDK